MTKDFNTLEEATVYADEMRALGYGAYVETFYSFEGVFYTTLVWER